MKIKFLQTRSPLHRVNCANPLKPLAQFLAASLGVSFNTIKTSEIDSGDDSVVEAHRASSVQVGTRCGGSQTPRFSEDHAPQKRISVELHISSTTCLRKKWHDALNIYTDHFFYTNILLP